MKKIYQGQIRFGGFDQNYETLFVGDSGIPFTKTWDEDFPTSVQVSIKYWISDTAKSCDELQENQLLCISGALKADYSDVASALTGYLWTDEELQVGGHDLHKELVDNVGKYLYMEVNY